MLNRLSASLLVLIVGAGIGSAAELRDGKIVVHEQFGGTVVAFKAESWPKGADGVTMKIEGPSNGKREGEYTAFVMSKNELPRTDLRSHGNVVDGLYVYEITGGTGEVIKRTEKINNGRDRDPQVDFVSFALSGSFMVEGGKITIFEQGVEKGRDEPTKPAPGGDVDEGGVKFEPIINRNEETKDTDEATK